HPEAGCHCARCCTPGLAHHTDAISSTHCRQNRLEVREEQPLHCATVDNPLSDIQGRCALPRDSRETRHRYENPAEHKFFPVAHFFPPAVCAPDEKGRDFPDTPLRILPAPELTGGTLASVQPATSADLARLQNRSSTSQQGC